jgi:hypothetical protein
MGSIAVADIRAADFDIVPWLIAAYVVFGLISALVRLIRQAGKAQSGGQQPSAGQATAAPAPQGMTAEQVRAALARRRLAQTVAAAAVRISAPAPAPAAPPTFDTTVQLQPSYDAGGSQGSSQTGSGQADAHGGSTGAMSWPSLLKSLPPAAVAILATAVIGPCAAHRGAGHQPEDW